MAIEIGYYPGVELDDNLKKEAQEIIDESNGEWVDGIGGSWDKFVKLFEKDNNILPKEERILLIPDPYNFPIIRIHRNGCHLGCICW